MELPGLEWSRGPFRISTDQGLLDLDLIYQYLATESYWARNIPRDTFTRAIAGSLCFGIYWDDAQAGFGRVITDFATMAYLADIFVVEKFRRQGLSKWLLECMQSHPDLQGLRRWMLATRDAHGLYERYGFKTLQSPENFMVLHKPDVYGS
ncbi:MAG: GNAT family N-acetyltransferase [Gammaproteobacteria bacterium RIFCSPLOWO2_12_FULL_52_10]|nr:MAG: GNAT family N-acetyltransferase [Gammaproteobacteria bacterium RIFCSPLOWO2_12_FULL_52_10]